MTPGSYQHSLTVASTASEAYRAVTQGYNDWWTATNDAFNVVGDRIRFKFPPNVSYWTFEARILTPNKHVALQCVEASHKIPDKPHAPATEWLGTALLFDIEQRDAQTTITLTHDGLVPTLDCYEICEAGWDFFFISSLKNYLASGVGQPHQGA